MTSSPEVQSMLFSMNILMSMQHLMLFFLNSVIVFSIFNMNFYDMKFILIIPFMSFLILMLKNKFHFFSALLTLEFITLSLIMPMTILENSYSINNLSLFLFFFISVCTACVGISVLVSNSRFWGNEYMKN